MRTGRARFRGLLIVVLLMAGFALKGTLIEPPHAAKIVSRGEFDTARAMGRLQRILGDQRPHPVDTAADDAVRDRLIAELRSIGLAVHVQDRTDCSATPKSRIVSCARVRNVIATIPGLRPGPQLLLNAHYDSTPTGPGAGDDGLGVAVLLEVGSILKESPPPRPVTLLFNEGEEFGLNGAHAFISGNALANQVNSLINIDVRGVTGPALMYETSDPNAAALQIYARAARRPFANSISTDFAKLIPNSTDVVFFKPSGWTLLNYSIIGNETRYHSPGDNLGALDRNSLGHVGSEVLEATRIMASTSDPASVGRGRTVFTDIAGRAFFRLPLLAAGILLGALLVASTILAWRRKALGRPLGAAAAMVIAGVAASAGLSFLIGAVRAGDYWRALPLIPYLAIYAVALLAMLIVLSQMSRNIDRWRLRAASWFLVLVLGTAASVFLPGATVFFIIAPALALSGLAAAERAPRAATLLGILAIVVQFTMFAELLALIEMLLIDGPLWAVAPLAVLAALPALAEADVPALRPAIALLAAMAVGLSAAAMFIPRASAERPLAFRIEYFRDLSANKALWAIADKDAEMPSAMPGRWSRAVPAYTTGNRWTSPAPMVPTTEPQAAVAAAMPEGAGRRVRLSLHAGGADALTLRFPNSAKILAMGIVGSPVAIPVKGQPEQAVLRCTGRSCEGLRVDLVLADRRSVIAELFATRFALPREAAPLIAYRPKNSQPQYAPDQTIVRSEVRL